MKFIWYCLTSGVPISFKTAVELEEGWKMTKKRKLMVWGRFNIPTAFLNGDLDKEIFIKSPKGIKCQSKIVYVNKSMNFVLLLESVMRINRAMEKNDQFKK